MESWVHGNNDITPLSEVSYVIGQLHFLSAERAWYYRIARPKPDVDIIFLYGAIWQIVVVEVGMFI